MSPTAAPVRVETITDAAGLAALGAAGWDDLVHAMPRPSPFLLHGLVEEWWRTFGEGRRLAVVAAFRGDALAGLLPAMVERRHGLRTARLVGGHESALGDVMLAAGEPAATAALLVDELRRQPFDLLDVFGLPAGSRLVEAAGDELAVIERVEAPVLLMPDGFEAAYRAKTDAKKRNLHRRRRRQLGELGTLDVTVARDAADLAPALEEAFRLHDLRWAGRPDGSTFGTPHGKEFHRAAIARLAEIDAARIVHVRVDGRPVAFHYYFALAGTMYVHRLAFDPAPAIARLSPGLVATLETLQAASDEGLTRVEYLGGDERYKLELSDTLEPLHQAVGLTRNPAGALGAHATLGVIAARKRLKRSARLRAAYTRTAGAASRLRRAA
jgi:CelD/BcsL family acetyltransferase involved in cellulose biosynthesis